MFRRGRLHETEITESLIAAAQRAAAHAPRERLGRNDDPWSSLRTDLLRVQAQSRCATATKQHDGQISQNLSSHSRKNIPLNTQAKSPA
jgi:hypothetical protein